jgi:5-methylcytosine-specific restriction protein A
MQRNGYGRIQGRAGIGLRKRRLAQEPLCRECLSQGIVTEATTVDHIIPLSQGGTDTDDNCQSLCQTHHEAKTAKDLGYRLKPVFGPDGWPED